MTRLQLEIDEHNLDQEWLGQAPMYMGVAKDLADAQKSLAEAKQELEIVKAETELHIRSNPDLYALVKVTEGIISATLSNQTIVQDQQKEVINCKHAVDVLQGAVFALDHRKRALENVVQLYLGGYFASPKEAKNGINGESQRIARRDAIRSRTNKRNQSQ